MDEETREWERRKLRMAMLEARRTAADENLWRAPILTLAVQAFLLQILATKHVPVAVGTAVAVAGALATGAAAAALVILHDRERDLATRVQVAADHLLLGSLRRVRPPERDRCDVRELVGYVVWIFVLIAFVLADATVLAVTQKSAWLLAPPLVAVVLAYGILAAISCEIREDEDNADRDAQMAISSSPPMQTRPPHADLSSAP